MGDLAGLYRDLLNERERDSARFWNIFYVLSLVNGLLSGAVATKSPPRLLAIIAAIAGILLSLLWLGVQRRMAAWILWWEARLQEVESNYFGSLSSTTTPPSLPDNFSLFRNRTVNATASLSTKTAAQLLPVLFLLVWAAISYFYAVGCLA